MYKITGSLMVAAVVFFAQWATANAQGAPYYQGKEIRVIVGFTPGGFFDRWARMLFRFMPKYIPGKPDMIVQNMPGAGGMIAANYTHNVSKPDGLTLASLSYGMYLDQMIGRTEARYDIRKFGWIGSPEKSDVLLYMRADSPYKSIDDIRKASSPPKCGSTGTSGTDFILARLLEDTLDLKITTVMGYPGGSEVDLAVEKGEVQCRGMTSAPYFGREPFITWRKKKFVNVLVTGGLKRDPRVPDTPTIYELLDAAKATEESRQVADVILRGGDFGRPLVTPPKTPANLVKILRDAHKKAMADPQLLDEAKKGKMEVDPVSGEELEKLADKMLSMSPGVVKRVKSVLQTK